MSPHARWRNPRIVNPANANREEELAGGLKNALERGATLQQAKQSFLNSGYSPQEIQNAIQKMHSTSTQIIKPIKQESPIQTPIQTPIQPPIKPLAQQTQALPQQTPAPIQTPTKKYSPTTTIIILSIVGVIIIIISLVVGLFWNNIF